MAEVCLGAIVNTLVENIVDYAVDPIVRQFRYLCCFNRNIEELETQLEKLRPITEGVQQWVDADHVQLRRIAPHIQAWLKSADDVKRKVGEIIKEKPQVKKGCLNGCIGWCSNLKRYSLSKEAVKKTKVIVDLQTDGISYTKPSCSPPTASTKTIPCKDNTAFDSRSLNMAKIIKALKDDKINLIGICGMPGVGKTTMANEVAKQAREDGLFDEVAWAAVGQMQDITNIQTCIANMLGLKKLGDNPSPEVRASDLRDRLLQDNKKILVILDDVWEEFDLEGKGFPLGGANKNFKMLYTSRKQGLTWHNPKTKIEICLELLLKDEAWELFREQVGDYAPDLQPIAEEIVNACGCLPLALVLIGKALSEDSSGNSTMNIWEDMRDRLTCSSSTPEDRDWSPTLELSYRAVKDEEAKSLFLLCCLFEEDKSISVEVLARYALGFSLFHDQIKEMRNVGDARIKGMRNMRNRVLKLVADLKRRFLLLDDPYKSDHKHVKVHDLVRDMGISIATKCKGALGSYGTVSEYPKKDAYDQYALVSHRAVSKWPKKGKFQHYTSISVISEEIIELPEELTCPNLEFLLLRCRKPEKLSCHFFKGTEKLKVLELYEYVGIIPTLQPLTYLTMLSLEGCRDYATVIEPAIGDLLNLEILSFRNSDIEELPKEIGKLDKLRLLDLTGTYRLCKIPPGVISGLVRLEELYSLDSNFTYWEGEGEEKGRNANLIEFERLPDLNTLEIWISEDVLIPEVPIFRKLEKYKVQIGYPNTFRYQYERQLMVSAQGRGSITTADRGGFDSLLRRSDLTFLIGVGCFDLVRELLLRDGVDGLQHLKNLVISACCTPKYLASTMNRDQQQPNAAATAVFPILEELFVSNNDSLSAICYGPVPAGSFTQLTEIKVYKCRSLRNLFPLSNVKCLPQLRRLEIQHCRMMEEVFWTEQREDVHLATSNRIEFPKLETLHLESLSYLVGFYRGVDQIDFPQLKDMRLHDLSSLDHIVHNNSNQSSNSEQKNNVGSISLFSQKVTSPSLETLELQQFGNVSDKLSAFSLYKLKELTVIACWSSKNMFYPSMAAVLVNLQTLRIENCPEMETVVHWEEELEERQGREIPKIIFPQLIYLILTSLPRLTRFCHFTCPIELPLLQMIDIHGCQSMKAFSSGDVSTPNLYFYGVSGNCNINHAIELMQEEDQRREKARQGWWEEKREMEDNDMEEDDDDDHDEDEDMDVKVDEHSNDGHIHEDEDD